MKNTMEVHLGLDRNVLDGQTISSPGPSSPLTFRKDPRQSACHGLVVISELELQSRREAAVTVTEPQPQHSQYTAAWRKRHPRSSRMSPLRLQPRALLTDSRQRKPTSGACCKMNFLLPVHHLAS